MDRIQVIKLLQHTMDILALTSNDVNKLFNREGEEDQGDEDRHHDSYEDGYNEEEISINGEVHADSSNRDTSACLLTQDTPAANDNRFDTVCSSNSDIEGQLGVAKTLLLDILQDKKFFNEIVSLLNYYNSNNKSFEGYIHATQPAFDEICPAGTDNPLCSLPQKLNDLFLGLDQQVAENQAKKTATNRYNEANNALKLLHEEKNEAQIASDELVKFAEMDRVDYLGIKNQCFNVVDGKFTYNICHLNDIQQYDGPIEGSGTLLGSFDSIEDGEDGQVLVHYKNGQYCHAFGPRTADVVITCASTNQIIDASEPSTCYYRFQMESPLGCTKKFAEIYNLSN